MQMLNKLLRDGWAVNKKWHDSIPTAGTNEAVCQSPHQDTREVSLTVELLEEEACSLSF